MNFSGHLKFSIALAMIFIYFIREYFIINLNLLIFYFPFYLIGAVIVDKIEVPGMITHRGLLHSRRAFLFCLILIPILYWKAISSQFLFLWSFKYTYWGICLAVILGHTSHLVGDSLTARLPR